MRVLVRVSVAAAAAVAVLPATADAQVLRLPQARRAVQHVADAYAYQPTKITTLFSTGRHSYYGQAEWTTTEQDPCDGCGYDPATDTFYTTYTTTHVQHAIALRATCIGRDTRRNRSRSCTARAVVTDIFG